MERIQYYMVFVLYSTKEMNFYTPLVSQRLLHVATNHVITPWPRWRLTVLQMNATCTSSSDKLDTCTLLHPPHTYCFLKWSFGKKNVILRSCQSTSFTKWPWLHYDEASDVVFCSVCQKYNTVTQGRFASGSKDMPFVSVTKLYG